MKKYLTISRYEMTHLIFIVPAHSKQEAWLKAKKYYEDQFGDPAPEKIGVYLIPEKDEVIHLTNIRPIVQTVEQERTYNYTPKLEYV